MKTDKWWVIELRYALRYFSVIEDTDFTDETRMKIDYYLVIQEDLFYTALWLIPDFITPKLIYWTIYCSTNK